MDIAKTIKEAIHASDAGGPSSIPLSAIELSVPEHEKFGHYATNFAMRLAALPGGGKKPFDLAAELAGKISQNAPPGFFEKVEAVAPGFINFWLSKETLRDALADAARAGDDYGKSDTGGGETVIVEYSQPNIAKMMHVGHLRTTIIGDALANILDFLNYKVVRWNYLGDWGTQFGKLIVAYKEWGKREAVEKHPIEELQELYVRFHREMEAKPELEKRGQEEFKKLEDGDAENRKLWEWFREESIKELNKMYEVLGVRFDVWIGEAFFESQMKALMDELLTRGIAEKSEGSLVVKLDADGLPPALIQKSDGASLYLTRDIANLRYRLAEYKPVKILYVVANEQSLHFAQLFAIAKMLGLDSAELVHVKYGLVLGDTGKKLSTRQGFVQLLSEALDEAVVKAREVLEKREEKLSDAEKREVAYAVGVGALKYNDLKENRTTDITFNWEKMLDFTGDSAPYLQYAYARAKSVLRKAGEVGAHDFARSQDFSALISDSGFALIRRIIEFPDVVVRAGELYSTSVLATYLYKLAVAMNKFYETTPILKDENAARRDARLVLLDTAARVLQRGLGLLGVRTPEKI
ncbi:MAG TPA: arginine--tRNA ligase [Candidatus Paceibacterota bacterium]|jgi:arginyl-tRNA synthetase|nr:arginine--tRNA ligase [Candidatus Paceibacterota bacterium]